VTYTQGNAETNGLGRKSTPPRWGPVADYTRLPNAAYRLVPTLGPMAALVYWALAYHADRDGKCWPSHGCLARELGLSERTVIRAIATVEKHGLVSVERARDGKTRNVYRLRPLPATGDCKSPVTQGHQTGDTQSPPPVTQGHPTGDTQSQEQDSLNQTQKQDSLNQTQNPPPNPPGGARGL
jgi:hypothetical protein